MITYNFKSVLKVSELLQSQQKSKVFSALMLSIERCVTEDLPNVAITFLSVSLVQRHQGWVTIDHRPQTTDHSFVHKCFAQSAGRIKKHRQVHQGVLQPQSPSLSLSVIPYRPSRYNNDHKKLGFLKERKDHRLGFFFEFAQQQPPSG